MLRSIKFNVIKNVFNVLIMAPYRMIFGQSVYPK